MEDRYIEGCIECLDAELGTEGKLLKTLPSNLKQQAMIWHQESGCEVERNWVEEDTSQCRIDYPCSRCNS